MIDNDVIEACPEDRRPRYEFSIVRVLADPEPHIVLVTLVQESRHLLQRWRFQEKVLLESSVLCHEMGL